VRYALFLQLFLTFLSIDYELLTAGHRVHRAHTKEKEMTDENATISPLSTAREVDKIHTTGGKGMTSSYSFDAQFYFELAVVLIGIVGIAGNSLILYALVVSKQHKKHVLIVNQNALDLFSSFFLTFVYILRLCNIRLFGELGYWLCVIILSEYLVWCGTNGSIINLATITIDRYLKVVHSIWSRKYLRPWVIYCAMAFAWISASVYNAIMVFMTSELVDGECYSYIVFAQEWHKKIYGAWYMSSFYFIILAIFIFCYGRILMTIRHQASVMAAHSGPGSSSTQAQSSQIQSNVIKTMILVSAFYAIAWLPSNVYYAVTTINPSLNFVDARYYVCMFIAFIYSSANPFIYATKFDAVRKVLIAMIPCKKNLLQPTSESGAACSGVSSMQKVGATSGQRKSGGKT